MFNLDQSQWRVIRVTVGSFFAFWLFSQIADSNLMERLWNQVAVLTLGAGAIRIWILEGAKVRGHFGA